MIIEIKNFFIIFEIHYIYMIIKFSISFKNYSYGKYIQFAIEINFLNLRFEIKYYKEMKPGDKRVIIYECENKMWIIKKEKFIKKQGNKYIFTGDNGEVKIRERDIFLTEYFAKKHFWENVELV